MLTACASSPAPSSLPPPPANLAQPCPPPQPPADGTGATLLRWAVAMVEDYRECSARQQG
ncbi:Rz1-like lysis system protein LysC, partial [Propionibacterium freudenreichii]